MTCAPRAAIIFVGVGDNGVWRKATPHDRRHHRAIRSTEPPHGCSRSPSWTGKTFAAAFRNCTARRRRNVNR
jgi:hypothetical protein